MSTATHQVSSENARNAAVKTTVVAAILPTVLSAQGMICVAHDLLALPWWAAVFLAAFLEIALISMALMSRAAILRGQHARVDIAATWALSAISGAFSALHEIAEVNGWSGQPRDLVAAAVRFAAPLVAAWLWHRLLSDDTRSAAPRTRAEEQLHRASLRVAHTALQVRRAKDSGASTTRLQRRLDRQHAVLLRRHNTNDLVNLLTAVGQVETLPAQTRPTTEPDQTEDQTRGADPARTETLGQVAGPQDPTTQPGPAENGGPHLAKVRPITVAADAEIGLYVQQVIDAINDGTLRPEPSIEDIRVLIRKGKPFANRVAQALRAQRQNAASA